MAEAREKRPARRRHRGEEGFTLLELLVVLGIIAMITAFAAPNVTRYLARGKTQSAATQIASLESALELYYLDNGAYPSTETGLKALVEAPTEAIAWAGPYLKKAGGLIDPWKRPYGYRAPGEKGEFDLYSLGRDGREGGNGENADITSW